jgi:gliding motility-associated-like protein
MIRFKNILIFVFFLCSIFSNAQNINNETNDNSALVPKQQIISDCKYFSPDSLAGFPLEAEIDKLLPKQHSYSELTNVIYKKEINFIKNKYKIIKLPFELAAEKNIIHTNTPLSAGCNNMGFDDTNDFTGWTGYEGNNSNSNAPLNLVTGPITPVAVYNPASTSCDYFSLISATAGNEPLGGFPLASPLGGYAARLGGEKRNLGGNQTTCSSTPSGSQNNTAGEVLERNFLVTTSNTEFQYCFAFVYFDDGTHTNGQQPYFKVEVLDQTGATINCLNYYQQGVDGVAPTGYLSSSSQYQNVYYTNGYQTSSLNLLPYLGQTVTIRFSVAGCYASKHFGYAYVDCACAPLALIIPTFACGGGSATLQAPAQSGGSWAWTGPGIVSGGTSQTATVNQSGTYSVTVTNSNGCSYVIDTTVTFFPNPIISVNSTSVCPGQTATLTAGSTGGDAGPLIYTWNPSGGFNFTNAGDSVGTIIPPSTTSYTVTGTSVHGCTATAVATVTVFPGSPPAFSANPVCLGLPTSFTNTTGGTGNIYHWNFGDGTPQDTSTQQNPTYTYQTAGSFPATLTVTTTSGCVSSITNTIVVNPLPTASFSAAPVCLGNPTQFTSTITNGNTYSWTFGDGNTNTTSATPTNTYTSAATFAVNVTVTTTGGCTVTATNSVIVNPVPTASFTVAQVCQGTPSLFDATASTPSVGATYNWNFGGTTPNTDVVTVQTDNHTYQAAGTFPVTLIVALGTCSATATGSAIVNPFPVLGFTATQPCNGTGMNFTNTTTNQTTISTWNWNLGDGSAAVTTVTPAAYTYSAAGCYSVVLTATASTGCAGSYSSTVNVHENPVAYFNALEACLGTSSDFMDSSYVKNPACLNDVITSWQWAFGDGGTTTYTTGALPDTVKHTYAACGPYNITLTVTTNNNCINTNTLTGDTVFCLPVVTPPPSFSVCPNMPVAAQTFSTTVTNGGPASAFWLAFSTHSGMPATDSINGGTDVVPGYTSTLKNLTCTNLIDTVAALAISTVGCQGNFTYYTVSLYPTPYLQHMKTDSVCANQTLAVPNFTACPTNSTMTWTNTNSGATGIGLAANGSGNIGSFTGTNTTLAYNSGQITATPTANGCVGNDSSFTIVVKPIPIITATGATVCPGQTVPSPTINTSPAGVSYAWLVTNYVNVGMPSAGVGLPSSYIAPANNSLINQIGIVTYTATLNGCIGKPTTDTINIKPTPFVNPIQSPFYCPNQVTNAINFSCSPTGGTPLFTWTETGGIPKTGNFPSFTTVNGTQSISQTTFYVNALLNGCQGPNSTFSITIYPNPIPKFSYGTTCDGKPMSFTDESTVGAGLAVTAWSWDMNNDGVYGDANTQNPAYTISPTGWDSVGLIVYTSTAPSCTAAVKEAVYVNPNPIANFAGDSLRGCPNVKTIFTDLSTPAPNGNIQSWLWTFGNGQISTLHFPPSQTYTNTSATNIQPYTVSLVVTSDSGCVGKAVKASYVQVYPKPIADFSWSPQNADINYPVITFVNQAIGYSPYTTSTNPTSYQYGPYGVQYNIRDIYAANDSLINNNTSFIHSYNYYDPNDVLETYNVTQWVVNQYGCTDVITKPVEIQPIVTFYIPNAFTPNNDGKNEGFKGIGEGIDNSTYNLWVFDRWGLMIYHAIDINAAWDGHMKGDEGKPALQEDVYVWKVSFNDIFGQEHQYHGTVTLLK